MKKFDALVIGAGSIGALKPDHLDYSGSEHILTHAHACQKHPNISLVGVVDIDPGKSSAAGIKWNCPNFLCIEEAFNWGSVDIVIMAVPTARHIVVMLKLLKYDFKLLIAEKPFSNFTGLAKSVAKKYKEKNIPIIVDYIRRFDEGARQVKRFLDDEIFGKVQNCRISYNRGLVHECCHGVDLCNYFFGRFYSGKKLDFGRIKEDGVDTSFTAQMVYEKCPNVLLIPLDGRKYSIFDVDIFCEKGRINLCNHGNIINYYPVHSSNIYGNYNTLSYVPSPSKIKYSLAKALYNLIDTAVKTLRGEQVEYSCSGEDAIKVHEVLGDILK